MRELGIDIETYSSADLSSRGVYRYVEGKDFAILLFAYSVDGGEPRCIDLAQGESIPDDIIAALTDESVVKTAYNAVFERVSISHYLRLSLCASQWRCTMARAARLGFPLSLGQCAIAMGLDEQKMAAGKSCIHYFSKPTPQGRRHYPADAPDKWELFKQYNLQDVRTEQKILSVVKRYEAPDWEEELYDIDQAINDRGVMVDMDLVRAAISLEAEHRDKLMAEARELTGLDNPNSVAQLKQYIAHETGLPCLTLTKTDLEDIDTRWKYYPVIRRVLHIRKQLGKASIAKYRAIESCVCSDGRIHGLLQYYGAARTGRWAGRLVQMQNLPQNHIPDLDRARAIVKQGSLDELELNYSSPASVLSELIRTAFIAPKGKVLQVCDFSAIEARVIAWLAREEWVLQAFREDKDIYCETASKMFHCPVEKHGRNAELRQKGKIAVLALGYGGGVGALNAMGGERMGLTEQEEKSIVAMWRDANSRIVKLWRNIDKLARRALTEGARGRLPYRHVVFERRWGGLHITLPSGRMLFYPCAEVRENEGIIYWGQNQTTRQWEEMRTYGGKLTENIVQAIARDLLAEKMIAATHAGYDIIFHVHDEIVAEVSPDRPIEELEALFAHPVYWCADLPLKGAGYATPYYKKD